MPSAIEFGATFATTAFPHSLLTAVLNPQMFSFLLASASGSLANPMHETFLLATNAPDSPHDVRLYRSNGFAIDRLERPFQTYRSPNPTPALSGQTALLDGVWWSFLDNEEWVTLDLATGESTALGQTIKNSNAQMFASRVHAHTVVLDSSAAGTKLWKHVPGDKPTEVISLPEEFNLPPSNVVEINNIMLVLLNSNSKNLSVWRWDETAEGSVLGWSSTASTLGLVARCPAVNGAALTEAVLIEVETSDNNTVFWTNGQLDPVGNFTIQEVWNETDDSRKPATSMACLGTYGWNFPASLRSFSVMGSSNTNKMYFRTGPNETASTELWSAEMLSGGIYSVNKVATLPINTNSQDVNPDMYATAMSLFMFAGNRTQVQLWRSYQGSEPTMVDSNLGTTPDEQTKFSKATEDDDHFCYLSKAGASGPTQGFLKCVSGTEGPVSVLELADQKPYTLSVVKMEPGSDPGPSSFFNEHMILVVAGAVGIVSTAHICYPYNDNSCTQDCALN
eukprot:gene10537-280_t